MFLMVAVAAEEKNFLHTFEMKLICEWGLGMPIEFGNKHLKQNLVDIDQVGFLNFQAFWLIVAMGS